MYRGRGHNLSSDTLYSLCSESSSPSPRSVSDHDFNTSVTPLPSDGCRTPTPEPVIKSELPLRKGHSPKNDNGDVMVLTPWYPKGLPKKQVTLSDEIVDFVRFISLTQSEEKHRLKMFEDLRRSISLAFPKAQVNTYGSFAYGASLSTSAIDIAADCCGHVTELRPRDLPSQYQIVSSVLTPGSSCYIQVKNAEGLTANISLFAGQSLVQQAVFLCRRWLNDFKAARAVAMVIRYLLGQVKCSDVREGGLSSYCVLLMVIHICRKVDNPSDPGEVLSRFLLEFGDTFPLNMTVTPFSARPVPKVHHDAVLSVLDPTCLRNNAASQCTKYPQIQQHFKYFNMALSRWDEAIDPSQRKGYKGRTPLSALVSHQPLWDRTDAPQRERALAAAKAAENHQTRTSSTSPHHRHHGTSRGTTSPGSSSLHPKYQPVLAMPVVGLSPQTASLAPSSTFSSPNTAVLTPEDDDAPPPLMSSPPVAPDDLPTLL